MHPPDTSNSLSAWKKILFSFMFFFIICGLFIAGAEIVLRLRGVQPWHISPVLLHMQPEGSFFRTDSLLGYTHRPGDYIFTKGMDFTYHVTQLSNTLRITHPVETYDTTWKKEEIWFFGGSFTYGWTLNNEETFAWLVQEAFPQYEVKNFGCNGYGTIQALVQIQQELTLKIPKVIVLMYAGFHDERNTFLRAKRKSMAPWNKLGEFRQPYARFNQAGDLEIDYAQVAYKPFPFMKISALSHFIEMRYNLYEHEHYQSHAVSKAIIVRIRQITEAHGVKLIVAGITDSGKTKEMLQFADSQGIANVDVSVDLTLPENNNLPHDGHPSAIANRIYAERLIGFLEKERLK